MLPARRGTRVLGSICVLLALLSAAPAGFACSGNASATGPTQTSAAFTTGTEAGGSSLLPQLPTDLELLASSTRLGRVVDLTQAWLNQTKIDKLPVYLPLTMPAGWAIALKASHDQGEENPAIWKTGRASSGARAAGYALSFTDGISRIQLVVNPKTDPDGLVWKSSATVSKATSKPVKVAQKGSTFCAFFTSPEKMSVYVWGDVSSKDQILEFAGSLSQRALLGASR